MRSLLAALLLLAAPWAQCDDATPTIRTALEAADAAIADHVPAAPAGLDEREAALRELEFRIDHMRSARAQMQVALDNLAANPGLEVKDRRIFCASASSTLRAPDFFRMMRGKMKALEKPKSFAKLTPEQVQRLAQAKASIGELEAQADFTCS
jgi:hypothetical protein